MFINARIDWTSKLDEVTITGGVPPAARYAPRASISVDTPPSISTISRSPRRVFNCAKSSRPCVTGSRVSRLSPSTARVRLSLAVGLRSNAPSLVMSLRASVSIVILSSETLSDAVE
jgi:hypothetical protein